MLGQNPQAQQIIAGLQAHMAEHFGFKYRQQIEQELGAPLPYIKEDDDEGIPEEYEVQLSRLIAQASTQLLQKNQQQAAQQEAQQQAEDPIIQMQKQELEIKSQDVQRKAAKDMEDIKLENRRLDLEQMRIEGQLELEGNKLGAKMAHEKEQLEYKAEFEPTKLGVQMAKDQDQIDRKTQVEVLRIAAAEQNKQSKGQKQ
jgi:hypothetical protein